MPVGQLQVAAALQVDPLSAVMILIVTGVGSLIHIFSVGYMHDDAGYARFFAYLNLFVFFMLVLVLGANFPVMFVGWEGVGLCSYLLIGFWYDVTANADAGKKAFIMNRIGDFGFLIAMFLIFERTNSLDFVTVFAAGPRGVHGGRGRHHGDHALPVPRMRRQVGPDSPVHLAPRRHGGSHTRVGADPRRHDGHRRRVPGGALEHPLCAWLRSRAAVVAGIGALTALFAATIALKQWDIKKVLAYSTVSQLGYMFVGVGTGAYAAGVFHLATHAFFKALLFLGSGSVIHAMHQRLSRTPTRTTTHRTCATWAGSKQYLPWTCGVDVDRDARDRGHSPVRRILLEGRDPRRGLRARRRSNPVWYVYWSFGVIAALLTAFYMTRMMLYTFHGPNRTGEKERGHLHEAPWVMTGPLVILGAPQRDRRRAQPPQLGGRGRLARALAGARHRGSGPVPPGGGGEHRHRVGAHRRGGGDRASPA